MTPEINHSKELDELQGTLVEKLSKAEGKIQKLKVKNQKLEESLLEKDAAIKKMEQECNMLKIELCKTANGEKFAMIAIFVSWRCSLPLLCMENRKICLTYLCE